MPVNINTAFPSKYLKADELDGDVVYTIEGVTLENVGTHEKPESKPVITFAETDKGMVLNKTNANTVAGLYGPDTDGWIGKPITLFATEVDFQGKQTLAIRVRIKAPKTTPAAAPPSNALLVAARRKAWDAFKAQHPGKQDAEITTDWRDLMATAVPNKSPSSFDLKDWQKVLSVATTPVGIPDVDPELDASDIPF